MTGGDLNEVGAHCPTCGAEYRPGFDTCTDDGTLLVPGPAPLDPPRPPEPLRAPVAEPPHGPWTRVASFVLLDEARLLAGRLNSEGIPARVYPEEVSTHYGLGTNALLGQMIDVLVPEERVLEAREAIERIAADG